MQSETIDGYLSAALDQEACKATLTSALVSRVIALGARGISDTIIVQSLEHLCDDLYQINDDVIRSVIVMINTGTVGGAA